MIFPRVRITCFRAKAHLRLSHWCLYNKQLLNEAKNDENNYAYREECWITASEIRIILPIIRTNFIDSM